LHFEARVADLVEEQRATRCRANDPGKILYGAGERTTPMPKQLRVEDVFRSRGAIKRDEDVPGASRAGMDRARHDFFACPGLACDQDWDIRWCDTPYCRQYRLHVFSDEDGIALIFHRVGRPQRRAIPFFFARSLKCERSPPDPHYIA
jgi:hypothetical protein